MFPAHVRVDPETVAEFCRRWQVRRLELFGSILGASFGPNSDIDILVDFEPTANWSLFDHEAMRLELSQLFGREVDLVSRRAVERSGNWIRRKAILESAIPLHVS